MGRIFSPRWCKMEEINYLPLSKVAENGEDYSPMQNKAHIMKFPPLSQVEESGEIFFL